jgi:hypothetical protein
MSDLDQLVMLPATITESDDGIRSLTVALDLSSLGVPSTWSYDSVIAADDGEVTLLLYPPDDE